MTMTPVCVKMKCIIEIHIEVCWNRDICTQKFSFGELKCQFKGPKTAAFFLCLLECCCKIEIVIKKQMIYLS